MQHAAIIDMAIAYTEAWCSRSGETVASFFEDDATNIINGGEATIGREAIAGAVGSFFIEFPDLVLRMDDLRTGGNQAIYLWTLVGTHSGPGGTGNFVKIPGWQNWLLTDNLLISRADCGYDVADYERQLRDE